MQCKYHSLPVAKIQQPSLRPLCEKCLNQTEAQKKIRLESMRSSLTKAFNNNLKELEGERIKLDRTIELFVGKNMTEAKKAINKKSLQAQKTIETSLIRQVQRANQILKDYTSALMQPYNQLENLTELGQIHLQFDEQFLQIEEKVQARKNQLKREVISSMKEEMKNFYSELFDF